MQTGLVAQSMVSSALPDGWGLSANQDTIRLRCPRCTANLSGFDCSKCGFRAHEESGIIHALPPDRAGHYAQFIEDYERIRVAEGRGGTEASFYLNLPDRDLTGRNSAQWRVRARTYHYLVKNILKPILPFGARILDLGAGNCWLSYRLALVGYRPVALDLLTNDQDGLGAAEHYRCYLPKLFPRFRSESARLPFQNQQFDAVVFNASFHYAENAETTMREALRCVKARGLVIVCDTPWYSCDESGQRMIAERRSAFLRRYGTASDSIASIEYLTDERLQGLEKQLAIRWNVYSPRYGFRWAMRPILAKMRSRREPAKFRIYAVTKASA